MSDKLDGGLLAEVIDHFASKETEGAGEGWSLTDDLSEYGFQFDGKDGSLFYLGIEDTGAQRHVAQRR